jgi:two-component system sporulation sensor kinase A
MKGNQFKPEYFDVIFSEFKNLESKIDEFLLLARPKATEYTTTNLWDMLQDVFMLLESMAILNNVHILGEPPVDQVIIMCDRNQLKLVFVNLLKNSIEAMPNGGEILVSLNKMESNRACVTIIDQGYGMNEETLTKFGEPFYSTKEIGTGLGLTISHKIVKEYGGDIKFQSELNKGTTVQVTVPFLNV